MSLKEFVTLRVDGHLLGVDAALVQDIFYPRGLTPVPTAGGEITGVLNLRGRIVTAVCVRRRLGLKPRAEGSPEPMAAGVEIGGDSYGLVVDAVEGVVKLDTDELLTPPGVLPPRWAEVIASVYRMEDGLLVLVDVQKMLGSGLAQAA